VKTDLVKVVLLKTDGKRLTLHLEEAVARNLMHELWLLLRQVPVPDEEPKR